MELRDRELRINMKGENVTLLHEGLIQLGFEIPDNERSEAVFRKATSAAVRKLQEQHGLERTGIVDERTVTLINRLTEKEHPQHDKPFVVRGSVVFPDGKPYQQILVCAYGRYLRGHELLGKALTDDLGHYEIHYDSGQFRRSEKNLIDLLVRAFSSEGEEVARSPLLFNVKTEETVNLVVNNEAYRGPSEYEELINVLTPACQEIPFSELKEDEEHQDISFLSGVTGADAHRIAVLVNAHRFQAETDVKAEVFYGLFRTGMPADLYALLMQVPDRLRRSLQKAVKDNIIPTLSDDEIDGILERMQGLIVRLAFEQPSEEESGIRLVDLLETVLEREGQEAFVSAYVAHKGPIQEFWQGLRDRPEFQNKVPALQFASQLGILTRNHLPLVTKLQRSREAGEISEMADLCRYSESDWHDLIVGCQDDGIGFPADVPGEDDDEKAHNYAKALASTMEDAFPSAFVRHRIEEGQLEGKEEIVSFLDNNPQFDIKNNHLGIFLAENNDAAASITLDQQKVLKQRLGAIQRVYKVAPRYTQTRFLLEKGLDSAYAINRFGKRQLALKYGKELGGPLQALGIGNCSQQTTETAMLLLSDVFPSQRLPIQATDAIHQKQQDGLPDWASLFGSLDLCQCRHCNSVYGPAAYLVDILHFLKDRELVEDVEQNDREEAEITFKDQTVLDILFERRSDLGEIELTCENTKTPLPYVDLVNEILEDFVTPPKEFAPFTLETVQENIPDPFNHHTERTLVPTTELEQSTLSNKVRQAFRQNGFPLHPQASVSVREKGDWWTIDDLPFSYTVRNQGDRLEVTTRGRQTNGTPEELEANPQYINLDAYKTLRNQVFPWQAPFDLWAEEARIYLDHLGTRRSEIMETFLPGDRRTMLGRDDIACEYLGLTPPETDLITGTTICQPDTDAPGLWNLWGFSHENSGQIPDPANSTGWISLTNEQDWLNTLKGRVDVFLQQSDMEYKDFLDLFVTHTISPLTDAGKRLLTIQAKAGKAKDTCELNELEIDGLDETIAAKIVRCVRLWRKLDWHFFDVDRIALALGMASQQAPHIRPPALDKSFLRHLSHVMRLHETLKVPVEELAAWWAPNLGDAKALCAWWSLTYIDHHDKAQPLLPSLYNRLFRNKRVINPLDPALTENPAELGGELAGHQDAISATLGISAEDVSLLDAVVIEGEEDHALNLENLSALFRHARLARALRLKIRDYLSVLANYAKNPFINPLETVLFVEHIGQIRASGFSITELDYLLRHTDEAKTEVAPEDNEIAIVLNDIRSGLQTIAAEHTFRDDPSDPKGATVDLTGDLTRTKLAQLGWKDDLSDRIIATLNDAITYTTHLESLPEDLVLSNDTGSYEADLVSLPEDFEFPAAFNEICVYDEDSGKLKAARLLTQPERNNLLDAASGHQDFETALEFLFKRQDELQGKIFYAAKTQKLCFQGVMTKVRQTRLKDVPNDPDYNVYREAVDTLFEAPRESIRQNLQPFLGTEAPDDIANTLFDAPTTPAARFALVLKNLLPHLKKSLSSRLVIQKLGEALGLEAETAMKLLTTWIDWRDHEEKKAIEAFLDTPFAESDPDLTIDREIFSDQFNTYILLHKVALVVLTLDLTLKQLKWLFKYGPNVDWPDLNQLPIDETNQTESMVSESCERLWHLCRLRDNLPRGESLLDELFAIANGLAADAVDEDKKQAKEDYFNTLTTNLKWTMRDLEILIGTRNDLSVKGILEFTFPEDFRDERLLWRLQACFSMLKRLGMSAQQCDRLSKAEISDSVSMGVRQTVRAKYEDAQWLKIAKPLRNQLREKQREALVAYLLAYSDENYQWRKVSDIYGYFLIDVEMSPCQMTSRIRQASLSVQLFVQRCFMHLEPEVQVWAGVDEKWHEWKWMKNYRVWEANRKVFLYPENWIEPELRDDKSSFFKALESELMQSDLTKESAENAFHAYLEKLDQVSRLEIVGMHHQVEVDILHVFGRTGTIPHIYYYRQLAEGTEWTPWERIELDIEGDHLIPVVWNHRLYLFWPIFTKKTYPLTPSATTITGITPSEMQPNEYWEIKLAWSERKKGKWINKKISLDEGPIEKSEENIDDVSKLFFRWFINDQNNLNILLLPYRDPENDSYKTYYCFTFTGCNASPNCTSSIWVNPDQPVTGTIRHQMYYKEDGEALYLPPTEGAPALEKTPGTFLLLPHSDGKSITDHPFFLQDDRRTFFIAPSATGSTANFGKDDQVVPEIHEPDYEIPPIKDWLGPIADFVDPPPFSSFPIGPKPFDFPLSGGGMPLQTIALTGKSEGDHIQPLTGGPLSPAELSGRFIGLPNPAMGATHRHISTPGILGMGMTAETVTGSGIETKYKFETFYHPYIDVFVKELNAHGLDGLLHRPLQRFPELFLPEAPKGSLQKPFKFEDVYEPNDEIILSGDNYPQETVDFKSGGYALYNWELFFHAPFLIANRLSQNQRFEEAQKWFHYIFDPTDTSMLSKSKRYWRTKPFFEKEEEQYQNERIQNLLLKLAKGKEGDIEYEELVKQVRNWRKDPFKPHLIARSRTTAYQKCVVMKYIDNLIAWGDQLFRRNTMESVNEATQLYILAADILGKRPEEIPPRSTPRIHTYKTLEPMLGEFSNALVQIEAFIPPSTTGDFVSRGKTPPVTLPGMLYFCVPKNEKLLGYWDTVEDRLFKIRHCMNIEGVVQQRPLFAPPIDPGLLVKAAAAGVDISSALNDINAPLPYYRFNIMAQKATELCSELKSLGASLLSALEKQDTEDLTLLKARHEIAILEQVEQVKKDQIEEANESLEALRMSRNQAIGRFKHHLELLGVQNTKEPEEGDIIPNLPASSNISIEEEGGVKMIPYETEALENFEKSNSNQKEANELESIKQAMFMIPQLKAAFWGIGPETGGIQFGYALDAFVSYLRGRSADLSHQGSRAEKLAAHALRAHDWTLQSNQAAKEIMHVDKQIAAAKLRKAITEQELENHRKQVEQTQEIEQFMKDKYTSKELYGWMVGQTSGIYFQAYQLAYDVAKRAERAYRHELGLSDSSFIRFGYWDSLKKGLLSSEQLFHDIKRMEVAYLQKNRREKEMPKAPPVSLLQLDPMALVQLRTTGSCTFSLPEELYDLDRPDQYFRRIKSVAISIPCVAGPYAGVNCKLTLLKSSIRRVPTISEGYARVEEDDRFIDYFGGTESIVACSGQNDSGLFETNLHDERYLPFEGAGVISEWRLELPADPAAGDPQQFDYETISDVILHIRYTARDGGALLRNAAMNHLKEAIAEATAPCLMRLFSVRQEFPTEWAKFQNQEPGENQCYELTLNLRKEHYPFWSKDHLSSVLEVNLFARTPIDESTSAVYDMLDMENEQANKLADLTRDTPFKGLFGGKLAKEAGPTNPADDELTLYFKDKLTDLWIVITWSG